VAQTVIKNGREDKEAVLMVVLKRLDSKM